MPDSTQALKKAFPSFDPTLTTNWFGGIVRAIQEHGTDWAPIPALVKRTLQGMGILTRKKRRLFITKQVVRAIRTLCQRGVLFEYKEGRVKVHNRKKFDRYLESQPKRWSDVSDFAPASEDVDTEQPNITGTPRTTDEINEGEVEPWAPPPLKLSLQGEPEQSKESDQDPTQQTASESEAIARFFNGRSRSEFEKGGEKASAHGPGSQPVAIDVIDGLAKQLPKALPDLQIEHQTKSLIARSENYIVLFEARRDGSIRNEIKFSQVLLKEALTSIKTNWMSLTVGMDSDHRPAILRTWPPTSNPDGIVNQLVNDIQFLDDLGRHQK